MITNRNIAVVGACPYPAPQGSQVYIRDTARAFQSLGHDVRLVVYGYGVGEADAGLPVHRARNVLGARRIVAGPSVAKPFLDLAMVSALKRVSRAHGVDLVDAHNYEGLAVALAAGVRSVVYHAHNAMADELPYYTRAKRAARGFGRWLDRALPKRADHIVAPHRALADYLVECGCDPDRIAVIPPALDASDFAPPPEPGPDPCVLYTGNLDAYQNLRLLFDAMDRVRAARPGTRLVVATSAASDKSRLPSYAEVERTPDATTLRTTLHRDAVFVCPRVSWSGYPIKLLNAMAAGLPIVCCASAAHPVTHNHDGLIVPDNDPAAFADAVQTLLDDPPLRYKLGANARATIASKHDPASHAQALQRVAESLT